MTKLPPLCFALFILTSLLNLSCIYSQETCSKSDSANGVCSASILIRNDDAQQGKLTDISHCQSKGNLYRHSGTAQAYKANAPSKNHVCSQSLDQSQKLKIAGWPLTRRSFRNPPTLTIQVNLWSCTVNENTTTTDNECYCKPLINEQSAVVDVWQARPDGTYSSLRSNSGDCRAKVAVSSQGTATMETLAPGSAGAMGGLGPAGWDFAPYAAPVIHMLASASNHAPILVDIPIIFDRTTLHQTSFSWSDWRGHGWMTKKPVEERAYRITAWEPDAKENRIQISVDLYLPRTGKNVTLSEALCPARFYGLPWSFYKEPIAECAPFLLDFFAL